jgi:hypothetical protein
LLLFSKEEEPVLIIVISGQSEKKKIGIGVKYVMRVVIERGMEGDLLDYRLLR